MKVQEIYTFLEGERVGVLSTARKDGRPEAALMGFAATAELELIFDTVKSARKYPILNDGAV